MFMWLSDAADAGMMIAQERTCRINNRNKATQR